MANYQRRLCRSAWVGFSSQSVCLSVCLSLCLQHNSKTNDPKVFKLCTLEVILFWGSKVKVTRPINAHTINAQYPPNGKAYEVQTWYTDEERRPVSATSAVTSKVKGQGCKVTWRVWQVLADKSRTIRTRNTRIGGKVTHPTGNNAY